MSTWLPMILETTARYHNKLKVIHIIVTVLSYTIVLLTLALRIIILFLENVLIECRFLPAALILR